MTVRLIGPVACEERCRHFLHRIFYETSTIQLVCTFIKFESPRSYIIDHVVPRYLFHLRESHEKRSSTMYVNNHHINYVQVKESSVRSQNHYHALACPRQVTINPDEIG